jgi:hypothetical protein
MGLHPYDIFGLQTLRARTDLEFHGLTLGERPIAIRLDRREVHENVLTRLATNETISLGGVEPLHYTLLSHLYFHLILEKLFAPLGSSLPPVPPERHTPAPASPAGGVFKSDKRRNRITRPVSVNFKISRRSFPESRLAVLK